MKKIIAVTLLLALLLAGCGAPAAKEVKLEELYVDLESVGMPEMVKLGSAMMLDFYGIREEDVKQAVVTVCSDGLRADEVWLLEAVNADAAAKLKDLAEKRLKQKDAESVTYSPEQNAIVKKALLLVEGNYVIMITSPDVEAMTAKVNGAFGKSGPRPSREGRPNNRKEDGKCCFPAMCSCISIFPSCCCCITCSHGSFGIRYCSSSVCFSMAGVNRFICC